VYKGRDLHVDSEHEIVALKVIHDQYLSDRQIFGRFRREAAILKRLDGPHVCKLLDFVNEDDLLMIAIEYVDGCSLDEHLDQHGPIALHEAAALMRQIGKALDAAHERGVIHRDLKPSNVLVERAVQSSESGDDGACSFIDGLRVHVVDFGLAKVIHGDLAGTVLTEQDMIFGTPDYMSPEQVSGDELDRRSDVYAAGAMLYEMVVGQVPFDTPGPLTTMTAHVNNPVPTPSEEAPERGIGEELDRAIMCALSKRREERFDSVGAFAKAVLSAVRDQLTPASRRLLEVADTAHDGDPDPPPSAGESGDPSPQSAASGVAGVNTTMPSYKNSALESFERAAKVKVVVTDAPPESRHSDAALGRHQAARFSHAPDPERGLWIIVAVLAAVAAVVLGVYLGGY